MRKQAIVCILTTCMLLTLVQNLFNLKGVTRQEMEHLECFD